MNGCIFGWILVGSPDMPIAHHTGLILSWNEEDPLDSIIGHYGINSQPVVLVERLRDAVIRSNVSLVHINPHFRAIFDKYPYIMDSDNILPGEELIQYELNHPKYDIWSSNCQHFVQYFIGPISIESDLHRFVPMISEKALRVGIFGSDNDLLSLIQDVAHSYKIHRNKGICCWDLSLNIEISI